MAGVSVDDKAAGLLARGHVQVYAVRGDRVRARVLSSTGVPDLVYTVEHVGAARWRCTCPSVRRCAHIAAVELVTTPPPVAPLRVVGEVPA